MNIPKQIVDQKVLKIMADYPEYFEGLDQTRKKSRAFLLLGVAAYLNMEISEAVSYLTDGGNDGGFDAAFIEEVQDGQVNIVLFQSKYTQNLDNDSAFPANAIEKAINTVDTVFDPGMHTELNEESQRIVDEIRSLILDGYIPIVTFVMLNNGEIWGKDGQNYIDNAFGDQEQVNFEHFGNNDILGYIDKKKPINTEISMNGMAIQDNFNFKRVIIGKVNISEIVRLMDEHGDSLLERNIRKYLGKNEINDSIAESLKSDKRANFFFYNNGITMVCEKLAYNALQEKNWLVKTYGLQIINGGQTCRTICQTLKENPELDIEDVYVLVRIYEVSEDEDIIREITYATNHQNPVDLRDLKSNDHIQLILEQSARDLGYTYKRKRDNTSIPGAIPTTVAAEAVFAIWRQSPHLARYKKAELFGAYYKKIFENLNAAQMILAVLIFRFCDAVRKRNSEDKDRVAIRAYGNYFLSFMVGEKLLREKKIKLDQITHVNFEEIRNYFDAEKERLEEWAESKIQKILEEYFDMNKVGSLSNIDGRSFAAAFRRFDIVEKYLKNEEWWDQNGEGKTPRKAVVCI